jgi:hypothetical protein
MKIYCSLDMLAKEQNSNILVHLIPDSFISYSDFFLTIFTEFVTFMIINSPFLTISLMAAEGIPPGMFLTVYYFDLGANVVCAL